MNLHTSERISKASSQVFLVFSDLFNKRVSRQVLWQNLALLLICAALVFAFVYLFNFGIGTALDLPSGFISGFTLLPLMYFWMINIFGHLGRLHDLGYSGWWWFGHWIPLVGTLILWIVVLTGRGDSSLNKYGPTPKERSVVTPPELDAADRIQLSLTSIGSNPRAISAIIICLGILVVSLVTNRALESQDNARQVDYKSFEFSDALRLADIHGQENADGLQGFYAEYEV